MASAVLSRRRPRLAVPQPRRQAKLTKKHRKYRHTHAGSAFAHGALIACDPRDLLLSNSKASQISGALPMLTLMEEVLLLGIKDKQGYLSFWNDNISYAEGVSARPSPTADHGALDAVSGRDAARRDAQDDQADRGRGREDGRQHLGRFVEWRNMERPQDRLPRERLAKGLVDKAVLRTEKRRVLFCFSFFCSPFCTWSSLTRVGGRAFFAAPPRFCDGRRCDPPRAGGVYGFTFYGPATGAARL
ncbi:hypothetical protein K438DRAFT_2028145, partial [Mycena galopus ATCC 62051]